MGEEELPWRQQLLMDAVSLEGYFEATGALGLDNLVHTASAKDPYMAGYRWAIKEIARRLEDAASEPSNELETTMDVICCFVYEMEVFRDNATKASPISVFDGAYDGGVRVMDLFECR